MKRPKTPAAIAQKSAAKLAGAPAPANPLASDGPEVLAARAFAWEAALSELDAARLAAAAAETACDALAADVAAVIRHAALFAWGEAQVRLMDAVNAIEALQKPEPARSEAAHHDAAPAFEPDLVTITVIGPARGRRRAGFDFNATPQTITVPAATREAIEADPQIAVTPGAQASVVAAFGGRLPIEAFLDADGSVRPVKVLGPAKGRRRAGHDFGAEVRTIQPTLDELKLLLGDEQLSVAPAEGQPTPSSIPRQWLTVVSSVENQKVAGRVFGAEPVSFPLDELAEAQYRQLRDAPSLFFRSDYRDA
jgi:hypothetical protein